MKILLIYIPVFLSLLSPIAGNGKLIASEPPIADNIYTNNIYTINSDLDKIIKNDSSVTNSDNESPFRRFEISFLISLPFVFMANFITLHSYEVIKQRDFNVNVWEKYPILLPAATLTITTGISIKSTFFTNSDLKNEISVNNKEHLYYFCYTKKI